MQAMGREGIGWEAVKVGGEGLAVVLAAGTVGGGEGGGGGVRKSISLE